MFARGFKSWCEQTAIQQRKNLDLGSTEPLNPLRLAESLSVGVWPVENIPGLDPDDLKTLTEDDPESWSAVTLKTDGKSLIVVNSAHSLGRQSSDVMHEVAHIIIGHAPARIDLTEDGLLVLSSYDKKQEDEATWLAGCLLLPRDALLLMRRQKIGADAIQRKYGVTSAMLQYRLRVSGVDIQMKRARKGLKN